MSPPNVGSQGGDFGITITGIEEFRAKLDLLGVSLQKKIVRRGTRAAAKLLAAQVKANAIALSRADGAGRMKAVAKGIKVRAIRRTRRAIGHRVVTPPRSVLGILGARTEVGTKRKLKDQGYYPAHVEMGTRKTPARPYIRPAFAQTKQAAADLIGRIVGRGLEEEAAKKRPDTTEDAGD